MKWEGWALIGTFVIQIISSFYNYYRFKKEREFDTSLAKYYSKMHEIIPPLWEMFIDVYNRHIDVLDFEEWRDTEGSTPEHERRIEKEHKSEFRHKLASFECELMSKRIYFKDSDFLDLKAVLAVIRNKTLKGTSPSGEEFNFVLDKFRSFLKVKN